MGEYADDRRLFAVMRTAGWAHDPATGGFAKRVREGAFSRKLWVSWGQAEDALRLADAGERVHGVAPQSETIARVTSGAANGR